MKLPRSAQMRSNFEIFKSNMTYFENKDGSVIENNHREKEQRNKYSIAGEET